MVHLKIATSIFQSQVADLLPCNNSSKSSLTFALLKSYGLLEHFNEIFETPCCSMSDLKQFHTESYVKILLDPSLDALVEWEDEKSSWNHLAEGAQSWSKNSVNWNFQTWFTTKDKIYQYFLNFAVVDKKEVRNKNSKWSQLLEDIQKTSDSSLSEELSDSETKERSLEEHGLLYDCHVFSYLPMYCQVVTGATLSLSKGLSKSQERSISINWDGGRHHAFKTRASGFCYVNDIVLLIQKARRQGIEKISYVDFDLHHGDGVERAFQYSTNVQTISLHLFERGFFPGTGSIKEPARGKNIVNIPLLHGLDDCYLLDLTKRLVIPCTERNEPELIIIQCGGDGLMGDKYEEWQLSIRGLTDAIMTVVNHFPESNIVLLGGGGYNERVMSRFYTYLTWCIVKKYSNNPPEVDPFLDVDDVMPDHEFIDLYKDEYYKFWIYDLEGGKKKRLKNKNVPEYVDQLCKLYGV